tara:strand:- start:71 stop:640 length:570 start_codon:yes stop_codon:yes gene_type:complete
MKITLNEFYKRSTAKGIKTMRGHDGPSQEWNIYFDNKKICNCWDDSYGGELQVINYDGKSIEDIWNTIDKESTWDPNWDWHTNMTLALCEIKSRTLFSKDEGKGVLIGFNKSNYDIIGYKSSILDMLRKSLEYQKEYRKIFTEEINTKTDGLVLNWQYLEGCGIDVPEEFRWSEEKYVAKFRGTEPIEK